MSINSKISKVYPAPEDGVYLDTPSFGLTSITSIQKGHKFVEQQQKQGSKFVDEFRVEELPRIRKRVGEFLDADDSEFAFIPNFSFGLSAILASLRGLRRVLLFKDDYPSLTQPFLLNEYQVFWIEADDQLGFTLETIKQSILENGIQIMAISQVQYLTGMAVDIEELGHFCHENGVILIVDGTQSLGAMPFSFRNSTCPIYIASNYKWMNAGHGTGILCVKKEILERYPPMVGGFSSFQRKNNHWQYESSVQSYEPGHLNFLGISLLSDAVKIKLELGMNHLHRHNQELVNHVISQLKGTRYKIVERPNGAAETCIVGIFGNEDLYHFLLRQGIALRMRNNIIRIGLHFHNSRRDIDRFLNILDSYKSGGSTNYSV